MATNPPPTEIWYVPFDGDTRQLESAYQAYPECALETGCPFTVQLKHVHIAQLHLNPLRKLLDRHLDLTISSQSWMGEETPLTRIHDLVQGVGTHAPFDDHSLLKDEAYLCGSYDGAQDLHIEIKVNDVDTGKDLKDTLENMKQLGDEFGGIFPVLESYVSIAGGVVETLKKIIDVIIPSHFDDFVYRLELVPASEQDDMILQSGRYVVFRAPTDGTQYKLAVSDVLLDSNGAPVEDASYVVFRVTGNDVGDTIQDKVAKQEVARLLTQLNNKNRAAYNRLTDLVKTNMQVQAQANPPVAAMPDAPNS